MIFVSINTSNDENLILPNTNGTQINTVRIWKN